MCDCKLKETASLIHQLLFIEPLSSSTSPVGQNDALWEHQISNPSLVPLFGGISSSHDSAVKSTRTTALEVAVLAITQQIMSTFWLVKSMLNETKCCVPRCQTLLSSSGRRLVWPKLIVGAWEITFIASVAASVQQEMPNTELHDWVASHNLVEVAAP